MSVRGIIEIEYDGETIELSLSMARLEKIESLLGIGIPKLLKNAETNDLTLTQGTTVLKVAAGTKSSGKRAAKKSILKREDVHAWIGENGITGLFAVLTDLFTATFDADQDGEDEDDGGK